MGVENFIVMAIVAAAVVYGVVRLCRTLMGGSKSGCGSDCSGCSGGSNSGCGGECCGDNGTKSRK